jgi:hypothetical protein
MVIRRLRCMRSVRESDGGDEAAQISIVGTHLKTRRVASFGYIGSLTLFLSLHPSHNPTAIISTRGAYCCLILLLVSHDYTKLLIELQFECSLPFDQGTPQLSLSARICSRQPPHNRLPPWRLVSRPSLLSRSYAKARPADMNYD